jgi:hypothetical protein
MSDVLKRLEQAGWVFEVRGDKLYPLTRPQNCAQGSEGEATVKALIQEHRGELLAALRGREMQALHDAAYDRLAPLLDALSEAECRRVDAAVSALDEQGVESVCRAIEAAHARGIAPEVDQQRTEAARLLAMLQEAGERGVENGEIGDGTTGRRYSARLFDLRRAGWLIETVPLGGRRYRWVLRGRKEEKHAA